MRLFRRKKKETPKKSKPASIYYSPAAASTPTALRSEEVAVPQTPQERALADFAAQTPTLQTPVRMPNGGTNLDGADLRDTLARATIDPEVELTHEMAKAALDADALALSPVIGQAITLLCLQGNLAYSHR